VLLLYRADICGCVFLPGVVVVGRIALVLYLVGSGSPTLHEGFVTLGSI